MFLNRIDQLGDLVRDVPIIARGMSGKALRRELPGSDFPVVAGSAFWADHRLRGLDGETERHGQPKLRPMRSISRNRPAPQAPAWHRRQEQRAQGLLLGTRPARAVRCPGPADARISHRPHLVAGVAIVLRPCPGRPRTPPGTSSLELSQDAAPVGSDDETPGALRPRSRPTLAGLKERGSRAWLMSTARRLPGPCAAAMRSFSDAECHEAALRHRRRGPAAARSGTCDLAPHAPAARRGASVGLSRGRRRDAHD